MLKKFLIKISISILTLFCLSACFDSDSPEHFAEEVIELLKEKNKEGLLELIINEEDAMQFYSEMPSKKDITPAEFREQGQKQRTKTVKFINEINDYGNMNGGWDSAEIVHLDVRFKKDDDGKEVSKIVNIDVFVKLKQKTFEISLNDVLRTKNGWAFYNEPRWRGLTHDPKYDVIFGPELSLEKTTNVVLCTTEEDAALVNRMLTSDYWTRDEVKKRFRQLVDEDKCLNKELESNTKFTVIESGEYQRKPNKAGYPFHVVKIDILNATDDLKWTQSSDVFAQISEANSF